MSAAVGDTWYRYEDVRYAAPIDEFERPIGSSRVAVHLRRYKIRKVTPRGVWIAFDGWGKLRFVLTDARKRYACPTEAEAMQSFIARKERQARILRAQLLQVQSAICLAQGQRDPAVPHCTVCGTTKNLHKDRGSAGPYKCNSLDCVAF